MKKSERDEQIKKLQLEAEKLLTKIYDLQNTDVEPDPISFKDCIEESISIQDKLQKQDNGIDLSFEVRLEMEYQNLGIYLGYDPNCEWKIVKDSDDCWVLIPAVNEIVKVKASPKKRTSKARVADSGDFEKDDDDL